MVGLHAADYIKAEILVYLMKLKKEEWAFLVQ
jgi:hypothetical protein